MQLPDDVDLADAVADPVRQPLVAVRAPDHPLGDLTGWVDEVEVERSLTSDVPVEVGFADGYLAAETTVRLSGERADGLRAADELSPAGGASTQLIGSDLEVDMGLVTAAGARMMRQFSGSVRSVKVDRATREVELSGLDGADRLRTLVTLPVAHASHLRRETLGARYPWLTNSQWVVDHVLRKNGIFASPPPGTDDPDRLVFSATLHGSHAPEVAAHTFGPPILPASAYYGDAWYRVDNHPFGMLHQVGCWWDSTVPSTPRTVHVAAIKPSTTPGGGGIGFSLWALLGSPSGLVDPGLYRPIVHISLTPDVHIGMRTLADGGIGLWVDNNGTVGDFYLPAAEYLTAGRGWRFVGGSVDFRADGALDVRIRVDGVTWTWTAQAVGTWPAPPSSTALPRVWVGCPIPTSNVSIWTHPPGSPKPGNDPWLGEVHTSEADLSPGLNEVSGLPDVVAAESWPLLQEVAAVEYAVIGWNESGRPYFRNRELLAADATSVEVTLSTAESIRELADEVSIDSVRNVIGWQSTALGHADTWDLIDIDRFVAFESKDPDLFASISGVQQYDITVGPYVFLGPSTGHADVTLVDHTQMSPWDNPASRLVANYVAVFGANPTVEVPEDGRITVTWQPIAQRTGRLTITNTAGEIIKFRTTDGRPAMRLPGFPMEQATTLQGEVRRPTSIELYGERGHRLPDSPWRQLPESGRRIARSLLGNLSAPVPVIDEIPVVGDPRTQLGDTVLLVDRDDLSIRGTIVKIRRRVSRADGLVDVIAVRPIAPPGFGLLDDPVSGVLDSTLTLAP